MKVKIDTSKFGFIKRKDDGSIDYISPFPCPFNYGSVVDTIAEDGDREDVVVLGKLLKRGEEVDFGLVGEIDFLDKGKIDKKWICKNGKITMREKIIIHLFFRFFAFAKKVLNRVRGKKGKTELREIIF